MITHFRCRCRPNDCWSSEANAYNYTNPRYQYHECPIQDHLEVTFLYDLLPLHCKLFEINYEEEIHINFQRWISLYCS
jgi:hypothetical protein